MKSFKIGEGSIPALGLGTWHLLGNTCVEAVKYALRVGYRHIDTADAYGNHKEVGKALKQSGIKRQEIFLTTKVWNANLKFEKVISSAKRFLKELEIDYIDLLLIHWPDNKTPILETLKAFDKLKKEGVIKYIGVSNFNIPRLKEALDTKIEFVTNQVEFHPSLNQEELKEFCDLNNILITAYSPIAQGEDLKLPEVIKLAQKYNKSPSQVILNWLISKGMVAIPKSGNPKHIEDNFKTLEWEMEKEDIKLLDYIGGRNRVVGGEWLSFDPFE